MYLECACHCDVVDLHLETENVTANVVQQEWPMMPPSVTPKGSCAPHRLKLKRHEELKERIQIHTVDLRILCQSVSL